MSKQKDPCRNCDCMNEYGYCAMPFSDRWYACPIEAEKPENKAALMLFAEWWKKEQEVAKNEIDN